MWYLLLLFSLSSYAYLSYRDGSETCNWTSNKTLMTDVYNCESLTIADGIEIDVATSETNPIQIRVQGDAVINGEIDVSATGRTPALGGSVGGSCTAASLCDDADASCST